MQRIMDVRGKNAKRSLKAGLRQLLGNTLVVLLLTFLASMPAWSAEHTTYYVTNAQGTVVAEMDSNSNVTYEATYRPYGKQQNGPPQAGPGYTGHVNDPGTGLVYMQARYYDPVVGRFISIDPQMFIAGDIFKYSAYAYANLNPITNNDPFGLYTCADNDGNSNNDCDSVDQAVNKIRQAARSPDLTPQEHAALVAIKNHLGTAKDKNNVFIYTKGGTIGGTSIGGAHIASDGKEIIGIPVSSGQQNLQSLYGGMGHSVFTNELAGILAHETSHLLDEEVVGNYNSGPPEYASELRAYFVEAYVHKGLSDPNYLWMPRTGVSVKNVVHMAKESNRSWCNSSPNLTYCNAHP
jgi:RHS repeat-associated protein